MNAAVFFDRDGVVNDLVLDPRSGHAESPLEPEQVTLISGAAAALRQLHCAGYVLVGVSNQPAAAKGFVGIDQLERVQEQVLNLLRREGVRPDAFRICFHHPDGLVPVLTRTCDCRKPAPGMLFEAASDLGLDLQTSWMIGDTDHDVEAGAAAGCRTILIVNPASVHKRSTHVQPDSTAAHLAAAAELILGKR